MAVQFPPMPDEGTAIAMALAPFHVAVCEYRDRPDGPDVIRAMLPTVTLLGLGNLVVPPGGAPGARGYADARQAQTMVDLLHFTADDREYLPLWSDPNALLLAGEINPEWSSVQPLILSGDGIEAALSPGAWIVINPWSDVELTIAPRDSR